LITEKKESRMPEVLRVLLVEDDEEDKFLTTEVLREVTRTEYEITWVSKADVAITEISTGAYDVALLDYRLGAHTGLDVLSAVGAMSTPCILLTGQLDHATDLAAMEAGAADYLVKGQLTPDGIERSIRYAVERAVNLRSLRESERRFRVVVESASDSILLTDNDGQLLTWNQSALALFRLNDVDAQRTSLLDLVVSNEETNLSALFELPPDDLYGRRVDGTTFPMSLSLSHWEGAGGRLWSAIIRDVTNQRSVEEKLVHQAFHDPLTKLANRALFTNRVSHAIVRLKRRPGAVGVLFLDLDNFKGVNDTLGHAAGDALLTTTAERLLGCVRTQDTVARLGGDEFAVLVEDADDPKTSLIVADRIMRAMRPAFSIENREVQVSCSVGVAVTVEDITPGSDLLRDADLAMYAAKAKGKNCVEVFEDSMHSAIMDRVHLESQLRRGVINGEIVPFYQPILDLDTGLIAGFEALARWVHPERGVVGPNIFMEIAEATGLIAPIGRSVLFGACHQIRLWQDRFPSANKLTVSVNLSNRQIEDPSIFDTLRSALDESGVDPRSLVLEITESLMLNRSGVSAQMLEKIVELGVRIAIDDFGTGFSSLSYLQDLPLSMLKIDRAFVNRIDDSRGGSLVEAIIAMSRSLGLVTVAEGIEKTEQLEALSKFGCAFGQGYLFSKPVAAAEIDDLLLNQADDNGASIRGMLARP
jgi:diguanylate cyclase (GGDEF)-like protein/PAS domain S-box-containing protein